MALRKPRMAQTPHERAMAAWRAAVRPPAEDPTGRYHVALSELAAYTGRDVGQLVDEWSERAAARAYAGADRGEAERLAYEDLAAIATRRSSP